MPKVEDTAIELGSVYIYEKNESLMQPEEFEKFKVKIESLGIGERKIEGFGKVKINDPVLTDPQNYN